MTDVDYPFGFDATGRTRAASREDHVRDLVEQVLFTAPGERVNRPQFGSGLLGLVFEPNGDCAGRRHPGPRRRRAAAVAGRRDPGRGGAGRGPRTRCSR